MERNSTRRRNPNKVNLTTRGKRVVAGASVVLAAAGGAGLAKHGGAINKTVVSAVNTLVGIPNVPNLPDASDPNHEEKINEGIREGNLTLVRTDAEHFALYSLAEAVYPNQDPRPLVHELVEEVGTANIPLGTEVAVPSTPEALELHDSQFPSDG